MNTIISASLSPNTGGSDVKKAVSLLFRPRLWQRGPDIGRTESWFRMRFRGYSAVSFNSGRSALMAVLRSFGIGPGDEVIVQAFTCVAVPNSVLWTGATPVYADIDRYYNMDPEDAKKKISPRTKAIIVQHTFGIPADMDAFRTLCDDNTIMLIEDCAHALGAKWKGKLLGSMGDAAVFSFGRDKAVSSVFGGMAIVRDTHRDAQRKLLAFQESLPFPSWFFIVQQLLHPIAFAVILPLYTLGIGKLLLVVLQRLHVLSFPVYPSEKQGKRPGIFPERYPNALAGLLLPQLGKLGALIRLRQTAATYYEAQLRGFGAGVSGERLRDAGFLRYPILVRDPEKVRKTAQARGVLLGNWYHNIIDPGGVNFTAVGYRKGSCPEAEKAALSIINLPTTLPLARARAVLEERLAGSFA